MDFFAFTKDVFFAVPARCGLWPVFGAGGDCSGCSQVFKPNLPLDLAGQAQAAIKSRAKNRFGGLCGLGTLVPNGRQATAGCGRSHPEGRGWA